MIESSRSLRQPVLTAIACAAAILIFFGIRSSDQSWAALRKLGFYPDLDILNGAWWALITSAFVHVELLHIAFNLYWLWILGGAFERRYGPAKWLVFVLCAAFISSGVQFVSGSTGIGLSGVGYALFGFGWLARRHVPEFARIVTDQVVGIFIFWGLLCIVATYAGFMNVGNLAHGAGFVFGAGMAIWWTAQPGRLEAGIVLFLMAALSVVPLYYNPLSPDWLSIQAVKLADKGRTDEAIEFYKRSLDKGADPSWVWTSLAIMYSEKKDQKGFDEAMKELRRVAPNEAAKIEKLFQEPEKPERAGFTPRNDSKP